MAGAAGLARRHPDAAAAGAAHAGPRVGPNAVIQLAEALRAERGTAAAERVFAEAGLACWLAAPPAAMVPQEAVARLNAALFGLLPADAARAVAAEAGRRTGDYILAHRVPPAARAAFAALPAPLAGRLLLAVIRRHAWTFAGSGRCTTAAGPPMTILLAANPLAVPGCVWHVAVFERLFRTLVAASLAVSHTACCRDGAPACRFAVARPD